VVAARDFVGDLGALYSAYAPSVARWAARLGGPGVDVEDVVHDVFVVVERKMKTFRGDSSVGTWLYGITANVVRHARRKMHLRALLSEGPEERQIASEAKTPIEALEQKEQVEQVHAALDRLGEKYRTVLVLHAIEGLSGPEIARLTGTNPNTVWVRLHRARGLFLEALRRTAVVLLVALFLGTAVAAASMLLAERRIEEAAPPHIGTIKRHPLTVRSTRFVPRARVRILEREVQVEELEMKELEVNELEVKELEIGGYALPERKVSSSSVTHGNAEKPLPPPLLFDRNRLLYRIRRGTDP
jgi:RNA polymerase sigma-70 factor (ECF subfamily)